MHHQKARGGREGGRDAVEKEKYADCRLADLAASLITKTEVDKVETLTTSYDWFLVRHNNWKFFSFKLSNSFVKPTASLVSEINRVSTTYLVCKIYPN